MGTPFIIYYHSKFFIMNISSFLQNNLIFPGHPKGLKTNKYRPNNSLGLIQVKKTDQNKDSQYILNLDRSLQENEKIIPILKI